MCRVAQVVFESRDVQRRASRAFAAEYGREIPCAQQAEDGLLSRPEFR